jgi:NADPH:quinone reductase-like Zn-dependent oxidoreductase
MKALLRDRYGSPDVLRFEEVDKPAPTGDEVLVRVEAVSLNAADLDFLHGRPGILRLVSGLRRPRNPRIGVDVAGRVEAVGDAVTHFRIGDEVFSDLFSHGMGSLAEYVCAPERAFITKPASMTMEEAATFPHAAILALQAVRAGRPARTGERILINGASGNVGPFAIQIATSLGMEVTGVCSAAKMDFVRSIGADEVIDYNAESFSRSGRRWDRIVDVSGRRSMFEVRRALTADGVYTWVGGTTSTMLQALLVGSAMRIGSRRRVGFTFGWKPFHPPDVTALIELFESGAVKPVIDRRFPLEEAIDAIRYMDGGHHRGKVVITA